MSANRGRALQGGEGCIGMAEHQHLSLLMWDLQDPIRPAHAWHGLQKEFS